MNTSLTLPGKFQRLLRRCSPVRGDDRLVLESGVGIWCVQHVDANSVKLWGLLYPVLSSRLELDLENATGRAHASWWLFVPGCMTLTLAVINRVDGEIKEACAHLDPDDPRLLEDGSRWVDAEALRLVCLHEGTQRTERTLDEHPV